MSMTVWLVAEQGHGSVEADLTALFYLQEALDELCETLGVTPLGDFFDGAELMADFEPEDFDMDEEDFPSEALWHDPVDLRDTIAALAEHLRTHGHDFSDLDEDLGAQNVLDDCAIVLPALQQAIEAGDRVHLRVLS